MYNSKLFWTLLASTITVCISISDFAFLVVIPIGITSSAIVLKNCTIITAAIKKFNSVTKKKKKHDKIVLAKSKLNSIEVLTSKALIDSVSHDEFVLIK